MEGEVRTGQRRRYHRRDALCHCTAILRDPYRPEPSRLFITVTVTTFLASGFGWVFLWWNLVGFSESPCCLALLLPVLVLGWSSYMQVVQPARRGRLLLFPSTLVFQNTFGGQENPTSIPLENLYRVGRKRNRIHVVLKGPHAPYYFSCSRLHAEDMYDQILARLDEVGVEVTAHESDG